MCLPVKLADGKMSIKKGKIFSHLTYNIFSLERWLENQNLFHEDKLIFKI